jgi:hypothetical protein
MSNEPPRQARVPVDDAGTMGEMKRPHGNTYWLIPGLLLAGEHPVATSGRGSREILEAFLDCGIVEFVDLTEPSELEDYHGVLGGLAGARGLDARYRRFPIVDMAVPETRHRMRAILDHLDAATLAGRPAFVHCWGGIGRTGTVLGCLLVRHGLSGEEALAELAGRWPAMEKSWYFPHTPQTRAQFDYVRQWPART